MNIITKIFADEAEEPGEDTLVNILNVFGEKGYEIDLSTIFRFIISVIKLATGLAGVVGFVIFLYASIQYVTSMGDDTKAETAKKTMLWAIIGLAVVALATFIVNFVDKSLGSA